MVKNADVPVMELLMPQLADRMSKIYPENEEYKKCFDKEEKLYECLKEKLSEEAIKELDNYFHATMETASVIECLAYTQGMKDMLAFLKALS